MYFIQFLVTSNALKKTASREDRKSKDIPSASRSLGNSAFIFSENIPANGIYNERLDSLFSIKLIFLGKFYAVIFTFIFRVKYQRKGISKSMLCVNKILAVKEGKRGVVFRKCQIMREIEMRSRVQRKIKSFGRPEERVEKALLKRELVPFLSAKPFQLFLKFESAAYRL